jgi:hypothetical protein
MATSMGDRAREVRVLGSNVFQETIADAARANRVDELADRVGLLVDLVYQYTMIDDPDIDPTDEIINWTFPDVAEDLSGAIWNLASGFYKAAASLSRNAYELSAVSLAFQIEQNIRRSPRGYTERFAKWDRGELRTPNWGLIKSLLPGQGLFPTFDAGRGCNVVVEEAYGHYEMLCSFTHSRPYDEHSGLPTNAMSIGVPAPAFDAACFKRFSALIELTMSWSATFWILAYPAILIRLREGFIHPPLSEFRPLFVHDRGRQVFALLEAGQRTKRESP